MGDILINISSTYIALWGAITGSISLLVLIFTFLRDRPIIKITYKEGWKIMNAIPPYKEGVSYTSISVFNKGRRAIRIEKAVFRVKGDKPWILLTDSWSPTRNKILTEGKPSTEFNFESKLINFDKVYYIAVFDGVGKKYVKWVHFGNFLKDYFRISKLGK